MYLSGVTNDRDEPTLIGLGVGLMLNPGNSYHLRAERYPFYAADNGCFNNRWTEEPWLDWLTKVPPVRCLFAVAPDVYPDAAASLERGARYFDLIRSMGFPVAVVAQDGAERIAYPWDEFDALFIGGEARRYGEWKTSPEAERLVHAARNHGKWVHMGRVNSLKRLERARQMGCNSVDGTFLKYRRRKRAADVEGARDRRGAAELRQWSLALQQRTLYAFEAPSLPLHRDAHNGGGHDA